MNTYKPLRLVTVDKDDVLTSCIIREYALYNIDISKMILSGKYQSVAIENEVTLNLYMYNGFYCEYVDDRWVAHDLRVNEGMIFSANRLDALHLMIDNCLHDLALEEEKERVRKATQLAREKARNERS
jgi:hypothetical protein